MSECREFQRMEELRADAQLYGAALRKWQEHLAGCGVCTQQQAASKELVFALGSEAPARLSRNFKEQTMARVRGGAGEHIAAPAPLPQRRRLLLILNWVTVAVVCGTLGALANPAGDFRTVSLAVPMCFFAATTLLVIPLRRTRAPRSRT